MQETATSTRASRMAMLAALVATGAILEAPKLVLLTGTIPAVDNPAVGDLTIATFHGYADASPTPTGVYIDVETGLITITFGSKTFVATTGGTVADVITGWALLDTAKANVGAVYAYETPITIDAPGQGITVDPALVYGR